MTTKTNHDQEQLEAAQKALGEKVKLSEAADGTVTTAGAETAFSEYLESLGKTDTFKDSMLVLKNFAQAAPAVVANQLLELGKANNKVNSVEVNFPLLGRDTYTVAVDLKKVINKPGAKDGEKMTVYGSIDTKLDIVDARSNIGGIKKFRAEFQEACAAALSS